MSHGASRPEIYSAECRKLPVAVREEAMSILVERFSATNRTKDNALIIKRLFGAAHGTQHCFHSRQDVATGGAVMSGYKCAVALGPDQRCVGAACFRHVAPRRAAEDKKFTELLLLAVRSDQERSGATRSGPERKDRTESARIGPERPEHF